MYEITRQRDVQQVLQQKNRFDNPDTSMTIKIQRGKPRLIQNQKA